MSNELATNPTWADIVHDVMPRFTKIAANDQSVIWEKESQFALQAIGKNPALAKCDPYTVQDAIINVAAVGLTLNPADGYAYLVPESNKCSLRISFKGLVKAATDTGAIEWVKAEIVKEADKFEYRGPCELPVHNMNPFGERGATMGVYCIAKTNGGEFLVDVMARDEIDKIKDCAKTKNVWNNWPDEMAKKAIIKRASKQWPKTDKSGSFHKAIEVTNDAEGADFDAVTSLQETADYIIEHIEKDDVIAVGEAWAETTDDEKSKLWVAVSKGGYFSSKQKKYIRQAIAAYHEANSVIEGQITDEQAA